MSQRQLVWRALAEAGVLESHDPKVQEFVRLLRERRDLCWGDVATEFRSKYYDVFEKLIPALEKSDDPFIRNMLIKHADPERPRERQLLKTLATNTDFERDVLAAQQLAQINVKEVETVLKKRLPGGVAALVARQRGEGASASGPPAGGAEAAKAGAASGGGEAAEAGAASGAAETGAGAAKAGATSGGAEAAEAGAASGGAEAGAGAAKAGATSVRAEAAEGGAAIGGGDAGGAAPPRPSRKGRL